jgi:hypothetical protein
MYTTVQGGLRILDGKNKRKIKFRWDLWWYKIWGFERTCDKKLNNWGVKYSLTKITSWYKIEGESRIIHKLTNPIHAEKKKKGNEWKEERKFDFEK